MMGVKRYVEHNLSAAVIARIDVWTARASNFTVIVRELVEDFYFAVMRAKIYAALSAHLVPCLVSSLVLTLSVLSFVVKSANHVSSPVN